MSNSQVLVSGLSVRFQQPVLQNVFLKLKKGEFIAIVGKSGIGKTTFLNAVAGLTEFRGKIKKPDKVSFVFQNHSLFPWMTVKENISFSLENPDEQSLQKVISWLDLNGKTDYFPHQLSGGQQQRVAIGRALANKPDLLLLDEPFASLDNYTRLQMQDWIMKVLEENKTTTILVTHDVDEALLLSDRVMIMKNRTIENEYWVPFIHPRENNIRYSAPFQELKKKILENY